VSNLQQYNFFASKIKTRKNLHEAMLTRRRNANRLSKKTKTTADIDVLNSYYNYQKKN